MEQKESKIKYFTYRRKSTDEDDRQILSLESQEEDILRKFKELKRINLPSESISAFAPYKRPTFTDMIERIKKGEAQGIIAWHPDRLARNPIDAAQIIYLLDTGHLKDLKFCSYHFDNSPEGKMMLQIVLSQSKYTSDKLSKDVKRGISKKAEMGWRPGLAALGYINSKTKPKGEQDISNDPERFHLVKRLFQLMLTGIYSVPQLLTIANQELGLTMPATKKRPRRKPHLSELYSILSKPFYYGWYEWPKGSGNWIKGNHEPMITEKEFDQIQFLLGRKGRPRPKTHKLAFTGLMKCGSCGAMITAEEKWKHQKNGKIHRYIYYHCTHKINPDCTEKSIEIKNLNKQLDIILADLTISDKFHRWAIWYLHEIRKEEATTRESTITAKHKEYERLTNSIDSLLLKYTSPENSYNQLMTEKEYIGLRSRFLKEKQLLESELNAQGKETEKWVELTEKAFNLARYGRIWFNEGDLETRRSIFACLGSNFILKDKKLALSLQKPLQIIFESKNEVEKELEKLELLKIGFNKMKAETFALKFPVMSG